MSDTPAPVAQSLSARASAMAAGEDALEDFIRECVARNPGGYTDDFKFLLRRLAAARSVPDNAALRDHEWCVPHDHVEVKPERWERDQAAALAAAPSGSSPVAAGLDVARETLLRLDDKHYPVTVKRHPGEVCAFDSMTWPCDTQKALDAAEPFLAALDGEHVDEAYVANMVSELRVPQRSQGNARGGG